ncbi:MAG: hypothetical protein LIP16_17490 [Clostridium sp.]|nr:hypothetical protein [Clostridium sp.]
MVTKKCIKYDKVTNLLFFCDKKILLSAGRRVFAAILPEGGIAAETPAV